MIPQVGRFQGCYLDHHRNNWRCVRAVPALCENVPHVWYHSRTIGARVLATVVGRSPRSIASNHQPVPHPQSLSYKLNMCNRSKVFSSPEVLHCSFGRCARAPITLVLPQCKSPFTRVLFPCIIGGYHTLPCNTLAIPPPFPGDCHVATVSPFSPPPPALEGEIPKGGWGISIASAG